MDSLSELDNISLAIISLAAAAAVAVVVSLIWRYLRERKASNPIPNTATRIEYRSPEQAVRLREDWQQAGNRLGSRDVRISLHRHRSGDDDYDLDSYVIVVPIGSMAEPECHDQEARHSSPQEVSPPTSSSFGSSSSDCGSSSSDGGGSCGGGE
jgi:uncharacterized membrane protein YgcG